jgi:OOP family OmpA-OmpF porin
MKRKSLFALIALALSGGAVQAQDFDDRYYFAGYLGYYHNDDDRLTRDGSLLIGLGIGKYIAPNSSIDIFVDRTTRRFDEAAFIRHGLTSHFANTNLGASVRHYFGEPDGWQPFLMAGVGITDHRTEANRDYDPFVQLGGGLQYQWTETTRFRAELGYRYDFDDSSIPDQDHFGDFMVNLGIVVPLGAAEEVAQEEVRQEEVKREEVVTDCRTLDDDKDGVNNCDDKCPATPAGQIVGPDGCPQEVVIDLRGVEFKFDRPKRGETDIAPTLKEPSSDGIAILDQAVDVLNRYPQIRVEVAGHTDSTGSNEYNQGLSERRATIVYDYLTSHGVNAGRLVGPTGYGETRPVDTNDTKEGRQRNRRTELVIQK